MMMMMVMGQVASMNHEVRMMMTHTLSLSLSHTHTRTHTHSLTHTLSHTHAHTQSAWAWAAEQRAAEQRRLVHQEKAPTAVDPAPAKGSKGSAGANGSSSPAAKGQRQVTSHGHL